MKANYRNLIGETFKAGTVLDTFRENGNTYAVYSCIVCGNTFKTVLQNLKRNNSCGCYKRNRMGSLNKSHGYKNHKLYNVWVNIRRRCYDVDCHGYKHYGARGIVMCESWRHDAKAFIDWCLCNGYKDGLQIDRINNDGNYTPENCRFVGAIENGRNRRSNRFITYNGQTKTVCQWADELGILRTTLIARLKRMSFSDAINKATIGQRVYRC